MTALKEAAKEVREKFNVMENNNTKTHEKQK